MIRPILLALALIILINPYQQTITSATAKTQKSGNITGVVVARERANGDYSLGVSANYRDRKDKAIDEVKFKVPFKYSPKVGFSDVGWKTSIKGSTVTIKRNSESDNAPAADDKDLEYAVNSVNFRLDYNNSHIDRIKAKLKAPIKFSAYSNGDKVFENTAKVSFMPKLLPVGQTDVVFLPGRIAEGEVFSASIDDNTEQLIQESVIKNGFGEINQLANDFTEKTSLPIGGKTVFSTSKRDEKDKTLADFGTKVKLTFEPSFMGYERVQIRLNNKLSADVKAGDKLSVKYTDRFGEVLFDGETDQVDITDKITVCRFQVNDSAKYGLAGRRFCACGCFERNYSCFALRGFKIDGKNVYPRESSTTSISVFLSPKLAPGEHTLTYTNKLSETTSVKFYVLKVNGTIDQSKLWTGQSTSLRLQLLGTKDILPILLENNTPKIVRVDGGRVQNIKSSGGVSNLITRGVRGIKRGNFNITYKLDLPNCPCDDLNDDF